MTLKLSFATLLFAVVGLFADPGTLFAASPAETRWRDLCSATHYKTLTITKEDGSVVEGSCSFVNDSELVLLTAESHIVKIGRSAFTKILVTDGHGHELRKLHKHLHHALEAEARSLGTEIGPLALIGIPPTLAWGAVALPFCAAGDLHFKLAPRYELKIVS